MAIDWSSHPYNLSRFDTLPRGVYIEKDVARMKYHVEVSYHALKGLGHDPWSIIIAEALRRYEGEIREETLGKMSSDDLDTLAKMIIREMDRR